MVPLQAQKPYKPYKEQDYPHFSGVVEEFGGWRHEWMQKILPWISEEVALQEMNQCTPKNLDLSIYDKVEDVWRELGRLYGNPLTISSSVMENFLDMRPSDVPGKTEESQLAHLEKTLYRLNKRLGEVDEVHQLHESAAAVKQIVKLLPRSFARVWAASPEAKQASTLIAGPHVPKRWPDTS